MLEAGWFFDLFILGLLWGFVVKVAMDLGHHYRHLTSGPYV